MLWMNWDTFELISASLMNSWLIMLVFSVVWSSITWRIPVISFLAVKLKVSFNILIEFNMIESWFVMKLIFETLNVCRFISKLVNGCSLWIKMMFPSFISNWLSLSKILILLFLQLVSLEAKRIILSWVRNALIDLFWIDILTGMSL